jgi:glutamine synthetase
VLSALEVESRFNVAIERYLKQVTLEAETLAEIVVTSVVPAAEKQLASTAAAARALAELRGMDRHEAYGARVAALAAGLETALVGVARIQALLAELGQVHDEEKLCNRLGGEMRPLMGEVRAAADALELLVDDELWPLPKYREMLFVK